MVSVIAEFVYWVSEWVSDSGCANTRARNKR